MKHNKPNYSDERNIFIKALKNDTLNSNAGMELSLHCLKGNKVTNDS